MERVTLVGYRIKVNGQLLDGFKPKRGLRQGDSLTPYLFLICAKGFSALLQQAEEEGKIVGVEVCQSAPSVSHLLFADDSLILIRTTEGDAKHLRDILDLYECCSGQMINKAKSTVLFSRNTNVHRKAEVCRLLHITRETLNERYLRLPAQVGRSKSGTFAYIKDRIWQRIQGWKEKFLSWAGKEILIKAVAQAIPTFAMGCFNLTKSFCDKVSKMICRYWWN
jgi:hypothetical protein